MSPLSILLWERNVTIIPFDLINIYMQKLQVFFKVQLDINSLAHTSHLRDSSFLCLVGVWLAKSLLLKYALGHSLHFYGFIFWSFIHKNLHGFHVSPHMFLQITCDICICFTYVTRTSLAAMFRHMVL